MSINHTARSGGISGYLSDFFQHEGVLCVLINLMVTHILCQICSYWIFSKGLKDEFETAVVNEPSVFEHL